jgi:hypothetical protein
VTIFDIDVTNDDEVFAFIDQHANADRAAARLAADLGGAADEEEPEEVERWDGME